MTDYMDELMDLEESLKYRFKDINLLKKALTHSSYIRENMPGQKEQSNERLEFLGDAFFDAVIGEELYTKFPEEEEGFLSKTRATLVCEKSLVIEARKLNLSKYLLMGKGEDKNGGRQRESIIADAMEAVIGAVYLDGGYEATREVVLRLFDRALQDASHGRYIITDYKTHLQEKLQSMGIQKPRYTLIDEEGPDHNKTFTVKVEVGDMESVEGKGKSKKQAEQKAAELFIQRNF